MQSSQEPSSDEPRLVPGAGPTAAAPESLVAVAVRLALTKAIAYLAGGHKLGRSCVPATLMACEILKHFRVPHKVVVGYIFMPTINERRELTVPYNIPHTWVETEPGVVTDLAYDISQRDRKTVVLGKALGSRHAVMARYLTEPIAELPVVPSAMSQDQLRDATRSMRAYIANAPPHIRQELPRVLAKSLEATDAIDVEDVRQLHGIADVEVGEGEGGASASSSAGASAGGLA
jgi:hypothetical protein